MTDHASLYRTGKLLQRKLRVHYPSGRGRMVLRSDLDWERDHEPTEVSSDGSVSTFLLEARRPFAYFKPVLLEAGEPRWSVGANALLTLTSDATAEVYPHFDG